MLEISEEILKRGGQESGSKRLCKECEEEHRRNRDFKRNAESVWLHSSRNPLWGSTEAREEDNGTRDRLLNNLNLDLCNRIWRLLQLWRLKCYEFIVMGIWCGGVWKFIPSFKMYNSTVKWEIKRSLYWKQILYTIVPAGNIIYNIQIISRVLYQNRNIPNGKIGSSAARFKRIWWQGILRKTVLRLTQDNSVRICLLNVTYTSSCKWSIHRSCF